LATAEVPPLAGKHIGAVYDLLEFCLQVQLTEAQKRQLKEAVLAEYDAGGERRTGVLSAPLAWEGLEEVYKKAPSVEARKEFLEKNKADFISSIEQSPDFPYRQVTQSIIKASQTVVAAGPPVLTQQQQDSLLESFEFMLSVYLGKPFTFLSEDREALANAIVEAYETLPESQRALFMKQERNPDLLWALLRAQWTMMPREPRIAFRESMVKLLGYPVFQGSELDGAKALLLLPEVALSAEMRRLLTPKLSVIMEQLQDIPSPSPAMIGFVIYDY